MTLTERLDAVMREQSLLPNTRACYHGWVKAFYRHCQQPASVWTPEMVRSWMLELLRHAFATHAMQSGNDIKTVQELLGHEDLNTTAIYLHAHAARGCSPMDAFQAVRMPLPAIEFTEVDGCN